MNSEQLMSKLNAHRLAFLASGDVVSAENMEFAILCIERQKALIEQWNRCNPGKGNSWDDCAADIGPFVDGLARMTR